MSLATLAIRGTVGPLFVGHGAQKLFGAFGGHGVEGTGGFFESLGLRPGRRHAIAAGAAELGGGLLLALGALTPFASAALSGTMITAIRTAHAGKGPWTTQGGWEYNVVLLAAVFSVTQRGAGSPSVDGADSRLKGTGWALAQLAAGAAGSYLVTASSAAEPQPEQVATAGDPAAADAPRFARESSRAASA